MLTDSTHAKGKSVCAEVKGESTKPIRDIKGSSFMDQTIYHSKRDNTLSSHLNPTISVSCSFPSSTSIHNGHS